MLVPSMYDNPEEDTTLSDCPMDLIVSRLQHLSHEHGLVLREVSENCIALCGICQFPVKNSATYQCLECESIFLIHEQCAALPAEFTHPSHPQHPLVLSKFGLNSQCEGCGGDESKGYCYQCNDCGIALDVRCAQVTLPLENGLNHGDGHRQQEETIQHFTHKHPLAPFNVDLPNNIECKLCRKKISGHVYGCRGCIFLLHESCALLPREILQHPFDPEHTLTLVAHSYAADHQVSEEKEGDYAYHCYVCSLTLDFASAVSVFHPPGEVHTSDEGIRHFTHPHQLAHYQVKSEIGFECEICKKKISGDFCCCHECSFMIHKSCAELPEHIEHPLHPEHLLSSVKSDHNNHCFCSICGCSDPYAASTFIFQCSDKQCGFVIDMPCAVQSLAALKSGVAPSIETFHDQTMRLSVGMEWDYRSCIMCCSSISAGLCYACEDYNCHDGLHMECAALPTPSKLEHPFHLQHPLILLPKPRNDSIPCNACLQQSRGFTYDCAYCEFQMHVGCAVRKPTIKHHRHEHRLTYFKETGCLQCSVCFGSCSVDLYRCVPCNYNIHYGCMPLPSSVKHEWHIHEMVLRERVVDDFYDEQYCDLCEETRHPEHGVYYCEQCYCAVHIDCILPKGDIEQKKRIEKLKLVKLDEDIATLEEKTEAMKKDLDMSMEVLDGLKQKRQEMMSSLKQLEAELEST